MTVRFMAKQKRGLTQNERAVLERIKQVILGVGTPEGLARFITTYAGAGARTEMDYPHYTTVCVGPTGRAVQTPDKAQIEIDSQIERRDFPGVYLDDGKLFVVPSRHAKGTSFLEEQTGREWVVVANGVQGGKDQKPYVFAAVARELLK